MPLIKTTTHREKDESEWFGRYCMNQPSVAAQWDFRHVALEAEFANAASAWVSDEALSPGWLAPTEQTQESWANYIVWCLTERPRNPGYDRFSCDPKNFVSKTESLRLEFEALAKHWRRDTQHLSQISKKITHPAFLRIIGMGDAAVPLLLEALRDQPAHWFTALNAITNVDPVPEGSNPNTARDAWLAWGRKEGLID